MLVKICNKYKKKTPFTILKYDLEKNKFELYLFNSGEDIEHYMKIFKFMDTSISYLMKFNVIKYKILNKKHKKSIPYGIAYNKKDNIIYINYFKSESEFKESLIKCTFIDIIPDFYVEIIKQRKDEDKIDYKKIERERELDMFNERDKKILIFHSQGAMELPTEEVVTYSKIKLKKYFENNSLSLNDIENVFKRIKSYTNLLTYDICKDFYILNKCVIHNS